MIASKSVINEHTKIYPIEVHSFNEINEHWKVLSRNITPKGKTNLGLCRVL